MIAAELWAGHRGLECCLLILFKTLDRCSLILSKFPTILKFSIVCLVVLCSRTTIERCMHASHCHESAHVHTQGTHESEAAAKDIVLEDLFDALSVIVITA